MLWACRQKQYFFYVKLRSLTSSNTRWVGQLSNETRDRLMNRRNVSCDGKNKNLSGNFCGGTQTWHASNSNSYIYMEGISLVLTDKIGMFRKKLDHRHCILLLHYYCFIHILFLQIIFCSAKLGPITTLVVNNHYGKGEAYSRHILFLVWTTLVVIRYLGI